MPALDEADIDVLVPVAQRGPNLSFGYGAYNRFAVGMTDFGYVDIDDSPPYDPTPIRANIGLSYYAGSFELSGRLLALTGGPNPGGAVAGLYEIDPDTGQETRLGDADPGANFGWTGMAFNRFDLTMYGIATDCA
ncbi:MAG: hypothetical protein R3284_10980, partial [Rubricoccaceae bacterium]|nr:hypothetical protein [Rubricoccaceae bacterium]